MADCCPFCNLDRSRIVYETDLAYSIRDGYPISPGHTLILPKKHRASFFDLNTQEQNEIMDVIRLMRQKLIAEYHPDGFNLGINDGPAAGQTVMHLHIHLVPRFLGDCDDPRGGVRWIFPEKAAYWERK